jgi:hypothetical protein
MAVPGIAAAQQVDKGVLINGDNHSAVLAAGEMHKWTFTANAGEAILLSVGKVGDTSTFTPRLELFTEAGQSQGVFAGALTAHLGVAAPATTTYAVFVESGTAGAQNAGSGSYILTLDKAPGTFKVPVGDEGGPMTNGANHPGYIFRGDQDPWTFVAAAGEDISVSVGEVGLGPDTSFAPWIRLYGPDGAFLGQGFSQLGGQVSVTAPTAGTYTVVVASADATYSASGSYLVTLARRGPFAVPTNDEGGPMANGVVYQASITRADLDQWALNATAGQALSISAAEVGGDSGFYPWVRLYQPSGALVAGSFGATAAQINVVAPVTGQYTVVVSSADDTNTASGKYSLTASGIGAPPTVDLGDIAVNFGTTYGLYIHTNHAGSNPQWQPLQQASPTRMTRGDIDGTGLVSLIATFQGQGVWIWRSDAGWSLLHPLDASQIITADLDGNGQADIILNFPGQGLWVRYNNTTWVPLHPLDVTAVAAGNIDGDINRQADLIVNFAGYGVWAYVNNSAWVQLHPLDAFDIHAGDFDANGQDDLVMNFAGQGIWTRSNGGTWAQLHPLNSAGITIGDIDGDAARRKDIVINFPGYGVWAFLNNGTWSQIHPLDAPVLATVDLEKNGKDDVILNFPGQGIWLYKNNATFEQLHPADVRGFAAGRFDIN